MLQGDCENGQSEGSLQPCIKFGTEVCKTVDTMNPLSGINGRLRSSPRSSPLRSALGWFCTTAHISKPGRLRQPSRL